MKHATIAIQNTGDDSHGAVIPPIYLSTTYLQKTPGCPISDYEYTRAGNPIRNGLEKCIAAMEDGSEALCYASGIAATHAVLCAITHGRAVICDDIYGGTRRLFSKVVQSNAAFADLTDPDVVKKELQEDTTLVWIETPTNPTMKIIDIQLISSTIKRVCPQALFVVDNTFLSPVGQSPFAFGADIIVHSATKYLNGHCDVLMGVIVIGKTPNAFSVVQELRFLQYTLGAVPSPFDCFLCQRGLKTLVLRMRAHSENAQKIAMLLQESPKVARVAYPGLNSHPQRELACIQHSCHGGVLSFWLHHDDLPGAAMETVTQFIGRLRLFKLAKSLGGVESLVNVPSVMTHSSVSEEVRETLGISDGMIRMSVGIEDIGDLVADISNALSDIASDDTFEQLVAQADAIDLSHIPILHSCSPVKYTAGSPITIHASDEPAEL